MHSLVYSLTALLVSSQSLMFMFIWSNGKDIWPRPVCYTQGMRPCADEVDFQVDLRLTWGRPEANVLNVLVNTWNWMRSTWGWLEVDLQVYFVGTRPARFSKNVIYDIGTKNILLNKWVFVSDWYFVFLKKVFATFFRSEKFKRLYSRVQSFEFIRSAKGHQLNIQKHETLQNNRKIACDLGFAATYVIGFLPPEGD